MTEFEVNKKTIVKLVLACIAGFVALVVIFTVVGMFTSTVTGTATVLKQELGPQALNEKYEWFKNVYADLDAKKASIEIFEGYVIETKDLYGEASEWPLDVRADIMLGRNETKGMKASYNRLASDYNAEMAKWHTGFINAGKLPQGGGGEIPREVAAYLTR